MEKKSSGWRGILPMGGVILGVWLVLLITATQSTFWERDESRYATAALEMETSGNWLYPTFNHELRAFKPVMVYWLMAVSIQAFGPTEISIRLVSAVAIALVCLLTGLIAREFLGSGVWAAAIAGMSPVLILTGSAATTDATLLMFILLSQWVFVRRWLDGPRRWHVSVMAVAIGLAMLTKGPVGLAIPVLTIATALALAKGRSKAGIFAWKLTVAALGGIVIFLAWGIPANAATGNEYWQIAIARYLPKYLFSAMEGHGGQGLIPFLLHLPYYPLVLAVGFLPWTVYLMLVPGSFRRIQPAPEANDWARSREGLRVLLAGMILPTFILMTLMVSKLPHYILPVFPWFAIVVASALRAAQTAPFAATAARRMQWVFFATGILGCLGAAALFLVPWIWVPLQVFRGAGVVMGVLLLVLTAVLLWFSWPDRILTAVKIQLCGMAVLVLAGAFYLLPPLENTVKPAQLLAREIRSQIPPETSVATFGWGEPGMHFYLGAPRINHILDRAVLEDWLAGGGPRVLILNEAAAPGLALPPEGFRLLSTRGGIDHVRGRVIRLSAFLRD